ncbi:MAG: hypothetical protein AAF401_01275 [Pseudomonadota bacterium]
MNKHQRIAEQFAVSWSSQPAYETLSGELALHSLEEAYKAQAEVQRAYERVRGPLAGRKIALASKTMQEFCGIDHPVAGGFFAGDVHDSPAKVAKNGFRNMGLEFELALQLGEAPDPSREYDSESIRALVSGARAAFEIVDDGGADYSAFDLRTMVANNAWNGAVILGGDVPDWSDRSLDELPARLSQDGEADAFATSGDADPLGSLAFVVNQVSSTGGRVQAGEWVITGSVLQTRFPSVGDHFVYDIAGAKVELTVV